MTRREEINVRSETEVITGLVVLYGCGKNDPIGYMHFDSIRGRECYGDSRACSRERGELNIDGGFFLRR